MKQTFLKSVLLLMMLIVVAGFTVSQPCAEATDDQATYSRSYQADDDSTNSRHHRRPKHRGAPFMKVLDLDRDGQLSADEIASSSSSLLTLDEDGDGTLSCDELHPGPPPRDREERDFQ